MPTIKKIPKTVEITHAVIQGQVPNIAKTDEIPRSSCRGEARQTVVQKQCPTLWRSKLGCISAVQYENEVVDMPIVEGRRARFRRAGSSNLVAGYGSSGQHRISIFRQTHGTCRCET